MNMDMLHGKTWNAIWICLAGVCYGGYLIWRGASGRVLRGRFTGEPVIPAGMYIAGGVFVVFLSAGTMIAILWSALSG